MPKIEWPTLALVLACLCVWAGATTWLVGVSLPLSIILTALSIALFCSLQHEIIHGHPFRSRFANEALVFPTLCLVIPFQRFRETHLAHHTDSLLTDPYDDPESNYLDGGDWETLPGPVKAILRANNTLLGRLILGPILAQIAFMRDDWHQIRAGDRIVLTGWLWHIPSVSLVLAWVWLAPMPIWAYLIAAYLGLSILKIRTFLEHQAHARARGRTVIIEDRGVLAFLFLNNNLHVVHHMHPKVPWYRLRQIYHANRARYLEQNDGYLYTSYAQVFRRYFWRAKDPVAHPLWRR